jgi:hypothetical protein
MTLERFPHRQAMNFYVQGDKFRPSRMLVRDRCGRRWHCLLECGATISGVVSWNWISACPGRVARQFSQEFPVSVVDAKVCSSSEFSQVVDCGKKLFGSVDSNVTP